MDRVQHPDIVSYAIFKAIVKTEEEKVEKKSESTIGTDLKHAVMLIKESFTSVTSLIANWDTLNHSPALIVNIKSARKLDDILNRLQSVGNDMLKLGALLIECIHVFFSADIKFNANLYNYLVSCVDVGSTLIRKMKLIYDEITCFLKNTDPEKQPHLYIYLNESRQITVALMATILTATSVPVSILNLNCPDIYIKKSFMIISFLSSGNYLEPHITDAVKFLLEKSLHLSSLSMNEEKKEILTPLPFKSTTIDNNMEDKYELRSTIVKILLAEFEKLSIAFVKSISSAQRFHSANCCCIL